MSQQKNTPADQTEALSMDEYLAIESAVMETARGRWFLEEFARRNRVADTEVLLDAISKLNSSVIQEQPATAPTVEAVSMSTPVQPNMAATEVAEQLHLEVAELSAAIQLTRQEVKELASQQARDGGYELSLDEMDTIFDHTEQAVSDILRAAEAMQASAWVAREEGTDTDICDKLDKCVIEIYTACTFQELTGQRISKLVSLINFTEDRVSKMLQRWQADDIVEVVEPVSALEAQDFDQPVDDDRTADVFETVSTNDTANSASESLSLQTSTGEPAANDLVSSDVDLFEGQDTFVSAQDTLKNAGRL